MPLKCTKSSPDDDASSVNHSPGAGPAASAPAEPAALEPDGGAQFHAAQAVARHSSAAPTAVRVDGPGVTRVALISDRREVAGRSRLSHRRPDACNEAMPTPAVPAAATCNVKAQEAP